MTTMTRKTMENGRYEGTFRWGRFGEADVPVVLHKNDHGWFCEGVNGREWIYPAPTDPWGGWGAQVAKPTPLEAVRGFLQQWNEHGSVAADASGQEVDCEPGSVATGADHLKVRRVED